MLLTLRGVTAPLCSFGVEVSNREGWGRRRRSKGRRVLREEVERGRRGLRLISAKSSYHKECVVLHPGSWVMREREERERERERERKERERERVCKVINILNNFNIRVRRNQEMKTF